MRKLAKALVLNHTTMAEFCNTATLLQHKQWPCPQLANNSSSTSKPNPRRIVITHCNKKSDKNLSSHVPNSMKAEEEPGCKPLKKACNQKEPCGAT